MNAHGSAAFFRAETIGVPANVFWQVLERQADEIADRVSAVDRGRLASFGESAALPAHRSVGHPESVGGIPWALGGGRPLEGATRALVEPIVGWDLGGVRVHCSARAGRLAEALGARAFTTGRHIVFGHGQYDPSRVDGRWLLAHELAHVVQQSILGLDRMARPPIQRYPTRTPHGRPYVPGVAHNHQPCGRWSEIQRRTTCSRLPIWVACQTMSPSEILDAAVRHQMAHYPLARVHVAHYRTGQGRDYQEDVRDFITRDRGVRAILASFVAAGVQRHFFKVHQGDYSVQDFRYAFGALDRLDFEVDSSDQMHVWFLDRYEFHPVYPGLYHRYAGDDPRETNCVHAAAVELKSSGARDFWMYGHGTVPLSLIRSTRPSTSPERRRPL